MDYNRYDNLKIKIDNDFKKVYESVLMPTIIPSELDIYVMAKETDRLDLLSFTYYNTVTLWWVIALTNGIVGSMYPKVGQILIIPYNVSNIFSMLTLINS